MADQGSAGQEQKHQGRSYGTQRQARFAAHRKNDNHQQQTREAIWKDERGQNLGKDK
jgi:hypothetical protein